MKSERLFPREINALATGYYLARRARPGQIIYLAIIFSLITSIALLPFIVVQVTVKSPGLLRASTGISVIRATSGGIVKKVLIRENSEVKRGQLLLEVISPTLEEKEHYLEGRIKKANLLRQDLKTLVGSSMADQKISALITPLYRQAMTDYLQQSQERQTRFHKVKQDYERNKKLYNENVIAAAEFENDVFELEKALDDLELLKQSQVSRWHQELSHVEQELADHQNQLTQTQHEIRNLNILAPVSGTIQNLAGIYPGSQLFANQDLTQISPETELVAAAYVSPDDIGLLHEGMNVRMQINAFDHNQWGLLPGTIRDISSDIRLRNDQPVFEIVCSLTQDYLSLKNGYPGKLKKGMSLQARFLVAERSLWQLLYDRVDSWVNPDIRH